MDFCSLVAFVTCRSGHGSLYCCPLDAEPHLLPWSLLPGIIVPPQSVGSSGVKCPSVLLPVLGAETLQRLAPPANSASSSLSIFLLTTTVPARAVFRVRTQTSVSGFLIASTLRGPVIAIWTPASIPSTRLVST